MTLHDRHLGRTLAEGADRLRIAEGTTLVLAVSGGPDSMALLHGATRLAPGRAWQLVVAHLDHGLRPDSGADAAFVTDAADQLGLPWRLRRTDVAAEAAQAGMGVEEAGRGARYAFLDEVADGLGPDALVATAHTADDLAETVLLNLVRGAGLHGMRGMPARRSRVIRPLLHARRAPLRAALDEAGIAYRLDPTNADTERARARVRSEILPALERLNPATVGDVVRVPRVLYKLTAAAPRILPRPVIRRDSGLLNRSKEEGA